MKCKGQSNGDKEYHEPIKNAKKEPYKKQLHPETLGHKSSIKPPKNNFKFLLKIKSKKKKTFSYNMLVMVGLKDHPKGALNSAFNTPLVFAFHCTYFLVDEAIVSLCMFHCDGWLVSSRCKQRSSQAMVDINIVASK